MEEQREKEKEEEEGKRTIVIDITEIDESRNDRATVKKRKRAGEEFKPLKRSTVKEEKEEGSQLLSVDPGSSNLGWSIIDQDTITPVESFTENIKREEKDRTSALVMRRINEWMDGMVRSHPRITDLVIETQHYYGGACYEMCLIQGCIMGAASRYPSIAIHKVSITKVRSYWKKKGYEFRAGRSQGKKEGMKVVKDLYPSFVFKKNHESDSLIMGVAFLKEFKA